MLQVESYSFGGLNARKEAWRYLLPLLDMANHNEVPNCRVDLDQGQQAWVATALQDIRYHRLADCACKTGRCIATEDATMLLTVYLEKAHPVLLSQRTHPKLLASGLCSLL